jgi:hypothetical protein
MSHPSPTIPPPHLGHRLAAAGISAAVAVLFLMLALPLGRPGAGAPPVPRAPARVVPERAIPASDAAAEAGVLTEVDRLAREIERAPQSALQALDPLVHLLIRRSPEQTKLALERWQAAAQTAAR